MWAFRLLLITSALSLVSCASYMKRKECEKVNWFEHGKQVAMRGSWLNADPLLNECRKVEAEISETQVDQGFKNGVSVYCTPTRAEMIGKSGDLYSRDLCEGPSITSLLAAFKKGQNDYCQKSNGYLAGISGKKYQNVCSADQEKGFLPEYRKGRKSYLTTRVNDISLEIDNLGPKISSAQSSNAYLDSRLTYLEGTRGMLEARRGSAIASQDFTESNMLASELSTLDGQISNQRSQLQQGQAEAARLEGDRERLSKQLSDYKEELATLN
jgi:hypothetical protein